MPDMKIEMMDPATVELDPAKNVRGEVTYIDDLVDSITEIGVIIEPVIAVRTVAGGVLVKHGYRRTLAAIKTGVELPVWVVGDEATDDAGVIDRMLAQWHENQSRDGLTAVAEARMMAALFSMGVPAAKLAKHTRKRVEVVEAAIAAAGSEMLRAAVDQVPGADLDTLAAMHEFDGDETATAKLTAALVEHGHGEFGHEVQRQRDNRTRQAGYEAAKAGFEAQGVTILAQPHNWYELTLREFADGQGDRFTDESHATCPGHAAWLNQGHNAKPDAAWFPMYFCQDPKGNKHRAASSANRQPLDDSAATAERRMVRLNNDDWRSATTVRAAWLAELAKRVKPPKDGMAFLLESVVRCDASILKAMQNGWRVARKPLTGGEGEQYKVDVEAVTDMLNRASSGQRAQVIALAVILGAYEADMDVDAWRTPSTTRARYLTALAAWGYPLTGIEQAVAAGEKYTRPADDGQAGTDG